MPKKLSYEYIKEQIEKEGYQLISKEYKNAISEMKTICPNGHEIFIKWRDFQEGCRCHKCQHRSKKYNYEFVKNKIEETGKILISKKYNGNKEKLNIMCEKGHIYKKSFNKFQKSSKCPICYNEGKNNFSIIKNDFLKEDYIILSTEYKNCYTELDVICNKKHKIKISYKKFTQGTRCSICDIENRTGKNHWNWKGGISCEPYCEQWKDKEYKESIKERDGYRCLNPECSKTTDKLCIHHIDYNKKNCHPLNLITVCTSCNSKANKNRKWHKAWYQAIINKRYIERG